MTSTRSAWRTALRRWAMMRVVRLGEELPQGLMQLALGLGVQGGGRLVEDDDLGVCEDHARHRQTLALATGEPHPAAPEQGVEPLVQGGDDVVELGDPQCLPKAGVRDLAPQGQVHAHRVVEQGRVLQDDGDVVAHPVHADLGYRDPVVADLAGSGRDRAPSRICTRVVLPPPLAPTRATFSPGAMSRSMPSRTCGPSP